jgi:hypothetical protein
VLVLLECLLPSRKPAEFADGMDQGLVRRDEQLDLMLKLGDRAVAFGKQSVEARDGLLPCSPYPGKAPR